MSQKLASSESNEDAALLVKLHEHLATETESHKFTKQQLEYTERVVDSIKLSQQDLVNQLNYFKQLAADQQHSSSKLSEQLKEEKQFLLAELNDTKLEVLDYNLVLDQLHVEELKSSKLQQQIDFDNNEINKLKVLKLYMILFTNV